MENIVKTEQLYEGKAKKVFATNDPDLVIVDYKDDATAFNGEKKGTIVGKGAINNKMTNYMFKLLELFSSATSATSLATHSSTSIMLLVLVLLLRKRSRISQSMLSR